MVVFYFYGQVIPERVAFEMSATKTLTINDLGSGLIANLSISVHASQINVKVETNSDYDIIDLKNIVKSSVEMILDVFAAFLNGYAYNLDIISGFKEGESPIVFNVAFNQVNKYIKESLKQNGEEDLLKNDIDKIFSVVLNGTLESYQFSRALRDLKNAINYSDDTGFFSYRAIEQIRGAFYQDEDKKNKSNSWDRLRDKLNIERAYIDKVGTYRGKQAHGIPIPMTSDERADAIIRAWNIIYRFYRYLKNDKSKLGESNFPLLR